MFGQQGWHTGGSGERSAQESGDGEELSGELHGDGCKETLLN